MLFRRERPEAPFRVRRSRRNAPPSHQAHIRNRSAPASSSAQECAQPQEPAASEPAAALGACQVTEDKSRQVQAVVSQVRSVSGFAGSFMQAARAGGRLRYHHSRAG